jgi:hypothetical protein
VSYTQDDVTRLRDAMAKGAAQVRVGEEQVTFRSLSEMRSLLAEMEAAVKGPAVRQTYPQFVERP